jgi:type VI secretion system FHA domain protein
MGITVKIFTRQAGRPTLFQTREFETLPVTIGRDATCSLALDDPLKHISRVHVELEEEQGAYWMSVVSKVNPVMMKGRRYGPGTRLTLKSGDSFEMGEFEVQVLLPEPLPPAPPPREHKSLIKMLAGESGAEEIPPPEPGIFDEPTFVKDTAEPTYVGPAAQAAPAPQPPAVPKPAPAAQTRSTAETKPPVPGSRTAAGSMNEALRLFLEGAGMPPQELSAQQATELLKDAGAVLRAAVHGLMTLLIARAEMRKEFEAEERTMVAAHDNNPLKLMGDPHEALEFVLNPGERAEGFLDPVRSIGDASDDLRTHELALMAGMRSAIIGALRRLDPQVLEKAFDKSSSGFSLASRKARLWEFFTLQQQQLAQEAQEDFNKAFGRDFMSGYQAQLRRLKTPK